MDYLERKKHNNFSEGNHKTIRSLDSNILALIKY
jgi:hypothetical protein